MDEHDELAYHAAMATARTYLSVLAAEDKAGCNRILCDLGADKDGNTIRVVQALGAQALDFADVLDKVGMLNGGLVARRNEATLVQLDLVEAGSGGGGMPGRRPRVLAGEFGFIPFAVPCPASRQEGGCGAVIPGGGGGLWAGLQDAPPPNSPGPTGAAHPCTPTRPTGRTACGRLSFSRDVRR